ncbi:MAG: hypothetical protein QOD95_1539 [Gammaproteobacteria bacterium]|nr:hypothetical protein [Gammaproteobacteria bacterium]
MMVTPVEKRDFDVGSFERPRRRLRCVFYPRPPLLQVAFLAGTLWSRLLSWKLRRSERNSVSDKDMAGITALLERRCGA